jgi:hypothetical protein
MPTKTYIQPESAVTWTDTGGSYTMDCGGLAAAAVRVGAQGDLGADASGRADLYQWQLIIDGFDTAPVVAEAVHLYLAFALDGSNTEVDGDVGVADAAGNTADLPNLLHLGTAVVQNTTAANELRISGIIQIGARYVSPVIHNDTADALLSTSDTHQFTLVPIPYESQ